MPGILHVVVSGASKSYKRRQGSSLLFKFVV